MKSTKELRSKIEEEKKYYENRIEEENKGELKSLNYKDYLEKVKELDGLLILIGDYDELPEHTVDCFEGQLERIKNTRIY